MQIPCSRCGRTVHTHSFAPPNDREALSFERRFAKILTCADCAEASDRYAAQEARDQRLAEWQALCPKEFQGDSATVPAKLPKPHKLAEALKWTYGPRGLAMHGVSGTGKSRCAWMLLRREMLLGRSVAVLDQSFSEKFWAKQAARTALDWLDECSRAELLLADDVFKAQLGQGLQSDTGTGAEYALYNLLCVRFNAQRPTILTTNDVGDALIKRLSPDRGTPLVRRIREHFDCIAFD